MGFAFFLGKQIASGLFQPVLTAKECVGLLFVAKKGVKQRHIVDARSVTARMRAPPATPLATSESVSQFSVLLPEGCDPKDPKHSAFTPTALPPRPLVTSRTASTGCVRITASASGSHSLGGWYRKAAKKFNEVFLSSHHSSDDQEQR